jgi:PPOX class probable F420-dependent enzyme
MKSDVVELGDKACEMLREPVVATFATVEPDGSLHLTPTWIDVEDGTVIVNSLQSRRKTLNARRNPHVGVCVIDPTNPFRVVSIEGEVTDFVEDGAEAHIDALTQRYLGLDKHPFAHDGEVRVMIRIRPTKILVQPR